MHFRLAVRTFENRLLRVFYSREDVLSNFVKKLRSPEGVRNVVVNHADMLKIEWYVLLI